MLRRLRRKKSWVLIRNLVLTEVGAYAVFLALALSFYWAKWYRTFAVSHYLSFTVIEWTGLAVTQIVLVAWVVTRSIHEERNIKDIILAGEHEQLEFKSSLRWDLKQRKVNRDLERSVMKTVAAFLNSNGGTLIIGIDDRKEIQGLTADLTSLVRPDHDGFENHFNNLFSAMIGASFRPYVRLSFHRITDQDVCMIQVDRAPRPVFLKTDKGEDFYIRTGNTTTPLKVSEVTGYISSAWGR